MLSSTTELRVSGRGQLPGADSNGPPGAFGGGPPCNYGGGGTSDDYRAGPGAAGGCGGPLGDYGGPPVTYGGGAPCDYNNGPPGDCGVASGFAGGCQGFDYAGTGATGAYGDNPPGNYCVGGGPSEYVGQPVAHGSFPPADYGAGGCGGGYPNEHGGYPPGTHVGGPAGDFYGGGPSCDYGGPPPGACGGGAPAYGNDLAQGLAPGVPYHPPGASANIQRLEVIQRIEEARLRDLQMDTYEMRRKMGRPAHSMLSKSLLCAGLLVFALQLMAVTRSDWRSNNHGVFGYSKSRSFGLWRVRGVTTQYWQDFSRDTCIYAGELSFLGACKSPLCMWYELKCTAYHEVALLSMGICCVFVFELCCQIVLLVAMLLLTPPLIRLAAVCWIPLVVLHVTCLILYYHLSGEAFASLNAVSYYPVPGPGIAFILSCFSAALMVVVSAFTMQLSKMWPKPSDDSSSDDESDEVTEQSEKESSQGESDSSRGATKSKKRNGAKKRRG